MKKITTRIILNEVSAAIASNKEFNEINNLAENWVEGMNRSRKIYNNSIKSLLGQKFFENSLGKINNKFCRIYTKRDPFSRQKKSDIK